MGVPTNIDDIHLEDGKLYRMRDLSNYLKLLGLPYSKPTLAKFERDGVFTSRRIRSFSHTMRIFSASEMKDIASKIYSHILT